MIPAKKEHSTVSREGALRSVPSQCMIRPRTKHFMLSDAELARAEGLLPKLLMARNAERTRQAARAKESETTLMNPMYAFALFFNPIGLVAAVLFGNAEQRIQQWWTRRQWKRELKRLKSTPQPPPRLQSWQYDMFLNYLAPAGHRWLISSTFTDEEVEFLFRSCLAKEIHEILTNPTCRKISLQKPPQSEPRYQWPVENNSVPPGVPTFVSRPTAVTPEQGSFAPTPQSQPLPAPHFASATAMPGSPAEERSTN